MPSAASPNSNSAAASNFRRIRTLRTRANGTAKTRREFRELLDELGEMAAAPLRELKARTLFRGSNEWAGVGHARRAEARNRVLQWLGERGHKVVASGIVYDRLEEARAACLGIAGLRPRVLATVHTALAIQKAHYATSASDQRRNASMLFFDHQGEDQPQVARAIANPPDGRSPFSAIARSKMN